jgi:hypothetical protein
MWALIEAVGSLFSLALSDILGMEKNATSQSANTMVLLA